MTAKTIIINDIDMTELFPRCGYSVTYKKITGGNSGYMLDGTYVEDVLARKAVVSLSVMPLNEESQNTFFNALYAVNPSRDYATVTYFDPWRNDYRTMAAVVSDITTKNLGLGGTGVNYWGGITLVLTEA